MKFNAPHYISGGAYGMCERCGFKRRLNALSPEWTGLHVCRECHDPRPPELTAPVVYPEGLPRPDSRPEAPDTFITTPVDYRDWTELREDGSRELREDAEIEERE